MAKLQLPVSIVSREDARQALVELEGHIRAKDPVDVRELAPGPLRDLIREAARGKRDAVKALDEIVQQLNEVIISAPSVHIVLPASPDNTIVSSLTRWFRTNTNPQVLVEIEVRPGIAGGMVVRTPSRLYDWSFRSALEQNATKFCEVTK